MSVTPQAPLTIDIVSDVVCPWCIVGYRQLTQALADTGVEANITWHPFELNPAMPAEGQNLREHLTEKYGASPEDSARNRANLTQIGADLGFRFAFSDDMRMVNTFAAHQLLHWAGQTGHQTDLKLALFDAHFTQHKDISDHDVLADVAASVGLDPDAARAILEDARFAQTVREEQRFFTEQGISGVPAVIFDRQHLVTGAQGVENYTAILQQLTAAPVA